jgi:hypothetical protein
VFALNIEILLYHSISSPFLMNVFSHLLEGGDLRAVVFGIESMFHYYICLNLLSVSYMNCQHLKILSTGQKLGSYRGNCCLLCDHRGEVRDVKLLKACRNPVKMCLWLSSPPPPTS